MSLNLISNLCITLYDIKWHFILQATLIFVVLLSILPTLNKYWSRFFWFMYWSHHKDNEYYIDSVARFNYIFTSTTLVVTLMIAVVFFYTILTQSKQLGVYKWFIFNHTLWCFLFEIALSVTKPVLMTPISAGFVMGPMGKCFEFL